MQEVASRIYWRLHFQCSCTSSVEVLPQSTLLNSDVAEERCRKNEFAQIRGHVSRDMTSGPRIEYMPAARPSGHLTAHNSLVEVIYKATRHDTYFHNMERNLAHVRLV